MNVEIGAEAALFPGKEYISGNFVAVCLFNKKICFSTWIMQIGPALPVENDRKAG